MQLIVIVQHYMHVNCTTSTARSPDGAACDPAVLQPAQPAGYGVATGGSPGTGTAATVKIRWGNYLRHPMGTQCNGFNDWNGTGSQYAPC